MPDGVEFTNVHVGSQQRIRTAVAEFKEKWTPENWFVRVHGLPEVPSFNVWVVGPDGHDVGPILISNHLETDRDIFAVLEKLHEEWQIRTTPIEPQA
jgi:hypothetical protein